MAGRYKEVLNGAAKIGDPVTHTAYGKRRTEVGIRESFSV